MEILKITTQIDLWDVKGQYKEGLIKLSEIPCIFNMQNRNLQTMRLKIYYSRQLILLILLWTDFL